MSDQILSQSAYTAIDNERCEYTNSVLGLTTSGFLTFIEKHGITFEQAAAAR
jgi:hypothetical protein